MTPALTVPSSSGSYPIYLADSGFSGLGPALAAAGLGAQVVVVSNPVVGALYRGGVADALADGRRIVLHAEIPDGEAHKTLETWGALVEDLLALGVDRGTAVLALGGGVTGDIAGFAAATALRGLPLVVLPTTLLAMVDSAVGGKTGVNCRAGKNGVGAFHAPSLVYAALDTLRTLPAAELRCGLGEVVKHGLIGDPGLLDLCRTEAGAILDGDPALLRALVARSCTVKAAVVGADEREAGDRMILNLGHTVGHALETALGFGALRHGEAVAIGLLAEARWAAARRACGPDVVSTIEAVIDALGLPDHPPPIARAAVLAAAAFDKKRASGILRIPYIRSVGHAELLAIPASEIPGIFDHLSLED